MYDDDLSGVLPGRRFISIHPALLDIMGYHEAALIHEIRWRSAVDGNEWVHLRPAEWEATLHLTTKQVRRSIEVCLEAGWIEADKPGRGGGDHTRSLRLDIGAIRFALEGNSIGPGGQFRSAPEGNSSYLQELSQEVPVAALEGRGQPRGQGLPPTGPPEQMFPNGMCFGTTMPVRWWTIATDNQKLTVLSEIPEWAPYLPTAAGPAAPRGDAPSVVEDPGRENVIRRPEGLERALSRGYGFQVGSQADRRNIAKLLDLHPTIGQLDGAIEAMGWVKGQPLDLGRLVTKWATFSTARSTRPPAWKTERTEAKDLVKRVEAAGGNKHDLDGPPVDYGV